MELKLKKIFKNRKINFNDGNTGTTVKLNLPKETLDFLVNDEKTVNLCMYDDFIIVSNSDIDINDEIVIHKKASFERLVSTVENLEKRISALEENKL